MSVIKVLQRASRARAPIEIRRESEHICHVGNNRVDSHTCCDINSTSWAHLSTE
jgi:hypothetical protein